MNKFYVLILSLFFFNHSYSQNCSSQRYIDKVFTQTQRYNDIKYGEADPYGISNYQELFLDIEEPFGDTLAKRPLIVHQFGGGFLIGWRNEPVIPQMAEEYAKRGFVFATIDYRLGFNVLDGQSAERAVYRGSQDLSAALRFLVDSADVYGIDTSAIFITGTSAGCFSGFVNAFMEENDRAHMPSTYGITLEPADLSCMHCSGNNNYNNQKPPIHGMINNWGAILDTSFINVSLNALDNVPVISFHGTHDNIVPYAAGHPFNLSIFPHVHGSLLIHEHLDRQNIKNRLYPLDGLGHEPELLQGQFWVTDTILEHGSKFLYEIMYGDSIDITGDTSICLNTAATYTLPLDSSSSYCWYVSGGTVLQENDNEIIIRWDTVGVHLIEGTEISKREISKKASLYIHVQDSSSSPNLNFTSHNGLFTFMSDSSQNCEWYINGDTLYGNPIIYQCDDTGTYSLQLIVEDAFCKRVKDTTFNSTLCPNADFTLIQEDSLVTIISTSANANEHFWFTPDGSLVTDDTLVYILHQAQSLSFTLIASNSYCSDTITQTYSLDLCSHADFTAHAIGLIVDFTNQSSNSYFYHWDFGDGSLSALEHPQHTYASPGTYTVLLTTSSSTNCTDTFSRMITVDLGSRIHDELIEDFMIFPNPNYGIVYLKHIADLRIVSYELYDVVGKKIDDKTNFYDERIDLSNFKSGYYILKFTLENGESFTKPLQILDI